MVYCVVCFNVSSCAQVCRRLYKLTNYQPLWRRQCHIYCDVHELVAALYVVVCGYCTLGIILIVVYLGFAVYWLGFEIYW